MAKSQRSGKSYKDQYDKYKRSGSHFKNRLRKIIKIAKEQPNNLQVAALLLKLMEIRSTPYIRNRPHGGHICKGCQNKLGWVKNKSTPEMKKLGEHKFYGSFKNQPSAPKVNPITMRTLFVEADILPQYFRSYKRNDKRKSIHKKVT